MGSCRMTLRPEELVRIGGDPNLAPKVLPHPTLELFIDPTDGRSLASQIYAQLGDAITDGRLVTGDRLTPAGCWPATSGCRGSR